MRAKSGEERGGVMMLSWMMEGEREGGKGERESRLNTGEIPYGDDE